MSAGAQVVPPAGNNTAGQGGSRAEHYQRAQYEIVQEEEYVETTSTMLLKLINGPLGTLVMVFSGLGGFATLYMTRAGRGGQGTPLLGIALVLIALGLFTVRVLYRSGAFGHQFIDWG